MRIRKWFFEVSTGPKDEKARWKFVEGGFLTFTECQKAAIENNVRPYRIQTELVEVLDLELGEVTHRRL